MKNPKERNAIVSVLKSMLAIASKASPDSATETTSNGNSLSSVEPLSKPSEESYFLLNRHITGHDYFWALSEILDSAKECIFILDWWLSPELYLRRPPAYYPEWRVDRLLLRKAREGVRIHIVVYKEVTQTMTMSSSHTKVYKTELFLCLGFGVYLLFFH